MSAQPIPVTVDSRPPRGPAMSAGGAAGRAPTFGSLFAGLGGLDLGLERAGWRCRWQVERDAYRRRVLARHWPDVPRHGDIREVCGDELAPVDLICGGFPCQPVSSAGLRRGRADARWLWPEFARLVRALRPRFVLVENVPGLLSTGLDAVLGDLAACGYDAEWDCLPAAAFGAPHLRDRLYLVAYPDAQHGDARVGRLAHGAGTLFRGDYGPRPRLRLETADLAPRGDHGLPDGLDIARRAALGDAVVPQVAEWLGRQLMEMAS